MSTSGTTSFNMTALEVVEKAFARLGKFGEGMSLSAQMWEDGRASLNLILKGPVGAMEHLWTKTEGTLAFVADQEGYTLTSPRPQRILSVRRRYTSGSASYDIPLTEMSRQEYYDLPTKTTASSTPVSWYFDPQRSAGVLYLWPPPDSTVAADQEIRLTYLRRIEDISATGDDIDMPQEWLDAIVWLLADDLETQYPVNDPRLAVKIERKAAEAKGMMKAWDTESASIYLQPEYYPWPG